MDYAKLFAQMFGGVSADYPDHHEREHPMKCSKCGEPTEYLLYAGIVHCDTKSLSNSACQRRDGKYGFILSEAEYLESRKRLCPVCRSTEIDLSPIDNDMYRSAWHDCKCLDCNSEWTESYRMCGMFDLTLPCESCMQIHTEAQGCQPSQNR